MPAMVSVVFTVVALIALMVVFRKQPERRRDSFVSLFVRMTGTFSGVYFAVFVTDSHNTNAEKQQLAVMLRQAVNEIDHRNDTTESMLQLLKNLEQVKAKGYDVSDFVDPIREITSLKQLLIAPLFLKHLQPFYAELLTQHDNIESSIHRPDKADWTNLDQQALDQKQYSNNLSETRTLLSLAIEYLDNRIPARELADRISKWRADSLSPLEKIEIPPKKSEESK